MAELAAEGRSNPSIARELFVTRKTVEFHLGNAFRKLGVRRREELGAAMQRSDGSHHATNRTSNPVAPAPSGSPAPLSRPRMLAT